jgi:hypothetical protein
MSILNFISGLFTPISKVIDKIPTEEGKMELRNVLAEIESKVQLKMIEYDSKILDMQGELFKTAAQLSVAEVTSESWFVRHYKPAIVTGLFIMLVVDAFGLTVNRLPEIFVTVFSSAFGIISVVPSVTKLGSVVMDKFGNKEK